MFLPQSHGAMRILHKVWHEFFPIKIYTMPSWKFQHLSENWYTFSDFQTQRLKLLHMARLRNYSILIT